MKRLVIGYTLLLLMVKALADLGQLGFAFRHLECLPGYDKWLHFLLAGSFALVLNLAFRSWGFPTGVAGGLFGAIVPGTLLAVLGTTCDELSNMLFVARGWSPADLAANYLGILCLGVMPMAAYMLLARPHRAELMAENSVSAVRG